MGNYFDVRGMAPRYFAGLICTVLIAIGCESFAPSLGGTKPADSNVMTAADSTPAALGAPSNPTASGSDLVFKLMQRNNAEAVLSLLLVQIPKSRRSEADAAWNCLVEDRLGADDQLRLRRNGIRVGLGLARDWSPFVEALQEVDGVNWNDRGAVRVRPGVPLGLELDTQTRDQTLFFVNQDGGLSGDTWPASRNVVVVTTILNPEDRDRVRLMVVPEVRQESNGEMRWVRTENGPQQIRPAHGRAFGAAGFVMDIAPDEFVVIGPGVTSTVVGLVGSAMLNTGPDDALVENYIVIRAVMNNEPAE